MKCFTRIMITSIYITKKFKTILNRVTLEEVTGNIFKNLIGNKTLHQSFFVVYKFGTMILKTDVQLKLEELRKTKNKFYNFNNGEHIPSAFHCLFVIYKRFWI